MFPAIAAGLAVYQIAARVFPADEEVVHVLAVSLPGRQKEWISSQQPTVAAGRLFWFHPAMHTSQFPAVGVPEPPPTEVELFSATTVLCSAGSVVPNVAS